MLPNFLVVGAAKSGTTSLYEYFKTHPQIFVHPHIKETNFFINPKNVLGSGPRHRGEDSYGDTIERYKKLFENVPAEKIAIGEVCPTYLPFYEHAIPNILAHLGRDVKIVIILRNPINRAYSHYMHNVRDTDEELSFEDALMAEDERYRAGWWNSFYLKRLGLYSDSVNAYLGTFPNVKVVLFEDMKEAGFMPDLYEFLGVDPTHFATTERQFNKSGRPRSQSLQKILMSNTGLVRAVKKRLPDKFKYAISRFREWVVDKNISTVVINQDTKNELRDYFRKDIDRLSVLIGRDLSQWR